MSTDDQTTHFGFETIPEDQKAGRVHCVFASVVARYDVINDLMSAGIHRIWKQAINWRERALAG